LAILQLFFDADSHNKSTDLQWNVAIIILKIYENIIQGNMKTSKTFVFINFLGSLEE